MSTAETIISIIISLVLVIALYIFILPDAKRPTLNKFFRVVHDFLKIKRLMVESIFRFIYVLCVVGSVVEGIFMLFDDVGDGLLLIILGPIISRIVFELLLMGVVLVKNVMEINNHLKGIDTPPVNENDASIENFFSGFEEKISRFTTTHENTESGRVCPKCGKTIPNDGMFCVYCGTHVDENTSDQE